MPEVIVITESKGSKKPVQVLEKNCKKKEESWEKPYQDVMNYHLIDLREWIAKFFV